MEAATGFSKARINRLIEFLNNPTADSGLTGDALSPLNNTMDGLFGYEVQLDRGKYFAMHH